MTTSDITGTIANGVTLTAAVYSNPVTIDSGAFIGANANRGVTAKTSWDITNNGTVIGGLSGFSYGIDLANGGTVTNTGSIGGGMGVYVARGAATVDNTGTITGRYDSLYLLGGGTVTNGAGALIDGTVENVSTLTNAGTIIGRDGLAVEFDDGDSLLKILPGAAFAGIVIGHGGTSTIELAGTDPGTLTGLGTFFTNFGIVNVDAGADWSLSGTNTVGAGVTLTNNGTLTVNDTLINAGTIVGNNGTAVQFGGGDDLLELRAGAAFIGVVDGGAGTNTIELAGTDPGTLTGLGISFTNFGIVNVDAGADWTLTGDNDLTGIGLTANGTLTNAGTIDGNGVYVAGSIVNQGTITNTEGVCVVLEAGGGIDNQGTAAQIVGFGTAVNAGPEGAGTVINDGTIASAYSGPYSFSVFFTDGGSVTNNGSASKISGINGIEIQGGAGTVSNAGMIAGFGGLAVQFGAGDDLLELQAGATFIGVVDGAGGSNTLEFGGAAAGSFTGLGGASFTNFGTVEVDAGAHWSFTGTNQVGTGVTLTDNGTITGAIGIAASGSEIVAAGGRASGAAVSSGGTLTVRSSGTTTGATVSSGGVETVSSGGTASGTHVLKGGTLIYAGGTVAGAVVSSGGNEIVAGVTVNGLKVANGVTAVVSKGGTTVGAIVRNGGIEIVSAGATASGTHVQKGGTITYAGGTVTGVVIDNGGNEGIAKGAKVSGLTVGTGGTLTVSAGGTASNTVLKGGTEIVSAGGKIGGPVTFGTKARLSVATTPTSKTLTVSGFKATDTLDLAGFGFKATDKLSFVENAAKTRGVLTISSGALHASVTLLGQYVAGGFHLAGNGAAGTAITYSTSAATQPELAGHHG